MKNVRLILLGMGLLLTSLVEAQVAPVDDDDVAVGGYDVVAYFSGSATMGFEAYKEEYMGTIYYFSSKQNRKEFKKSPTSYLPQFGGYCAWAVAVKRKKLTTNPETFDIVDGKLYLFFNGPLNDGIFNTLIPWNKETTKLIGEAYQNWEEIKYLQ